ncbi:hypothetical protein MBLNU459_g0631t1 [Dothideomycetes sp. NU459]
MIAILLPAMQAPLDEELVALSTGVWTFVRGFGTVWGVTIPGAVLDNECRLRAPNLTNQTLATFRDGGKAYEYATRAFLDSIEDPDFRAEVVDLFSASLRTVWYAGITFAGLGWLLVWLGEEIALRSKPNTKYGLDQKTKQKGLESGNAGKGSTTFRMNRFRDAGLTRI